MSKGPAPSGRSALPRRCTTINDSVMRRTGLAGSSIVRRGTGVIRCSQSRRHLQRYLWEFPLICCGRTRARARATGGRQSPEKGAGGGRLWGSGQWEVSGMEEKANESRSLSCFSVLKKEKKSSWRLGAEAFLLAAHAQQALQHHRTWPCALASGIVSLSQPHEILRLHRDKSRHPQPCQRTAPTTVGCYTTGVS